VALSPMWRRAPRTIPLARRRSVARKYADRENRHIRCEIRNLEERPDMIGPMMKPTVLVLRERQSRALLRKDVRATTAPDKPQSDRHCERGW
jgi:hypothetical protein